mgnify:CR=1 FL=1
MIPEYLFYLSDLSDRNYYPIRLIKCPTNAPTGVPIILPRSAIRIPTGTKALLYAPASTGAVAVPPTFAKDATAQVKISILITFARMTITATWIRRIRKPPASHTGALPIAEIICSGSDQAIST